MVFSDGNRYNRDKEIVILSSEGGIPMTTHKIITIGRQFGSGGHEIGNLLATRLDIPLYDNNLVRMAAEKMDIREETAKAIDETSLNSFVSSYLITPMGYSSYINSEELIRKNMYSRYLNRCMNYRRKLSKSLQNADHV